MVGDKFFYPHTLCYTNGSGVFLQWINCREQPNTGGKVITNTEREEIIYKSLIFVPKLKDFFNHPTVTFNPGDEIQVLDDDGRVRIQGFILKTSVDGLEDNRIWI